MTTDYLIHSAIRKVADHQNISDSSLVSFTVSEILPVMEFIGKQARLIEQLKNELTDIRKKSENALDLITALEKKGIKEL